ncbi:MAG: CDP-diacylglycerol diphosphatase [Acetobacteraceae bacterium]
MHRSFAGSDALWRIVHDQCAPHEELFRSSLPCLETDEDRGIAILKDLVGATQTPFIPTARITGIEDPAVLEPGAPNYFALAWQRTNATRALANANLPRDALSLALNSRFGRTQDQLHIHIDCIRSDVRALLAQYSETISESWSHFPVPLAGQPYLTRRVATLGRPGATPFQLVATGIPDAGKDMGAMTIVVVGDFFNGEPGFVLLAGRASVAAGDSGSGEDLQDHTCALAHVP